MRRALFVAFVLASLVLVGCGDDEEPHKAIGFLRAVGVAQESEDALVEELAEAGWVEGENLTVLGGSSDVAYEDPEEAAAAARQLVDDGADVVITLASTSAIAARDAGLDVPIVFLVNDPVTAGLVTDTRTPDGNLTGTSFRVPADRTLDVLTSLGDIDRVAVLTPTEDPGVRGYRVDFEEAAGQLGLEAIEAPFTDATDAADAVGGAAMAGADAIALVSSPTTVLAFDAIEAAAFEAGLPVIANTGTAEFALIVLSPDSLAVYRQLGRQVARLLDETPVREVPVEDPAGFRLVLRRNVAERLGIELPPELVTRADEVEP